MEERRPYVKVPVQSGERVRSTLADAGLLDNDYHIVRIEDKLYLPLFTGTSKDDVEETIDLGDYEFGTRKFESVVEGPRSLEEALADELDSEELELLPRAYDLVGDIAVLEIPEELKDYDELIGHAFLSIYPHFSTVLAKEGAISGVKRTRSYKVLAGKKKTSTVHTEYGIDIAVDLSKAYFSPRLLEEHRRVAEQVHDDELVVDMFTGVGPFALHIAKRTTARIVAIDINRDAIELLEKSISLNRLKGDIECVATNAEEYVQSHFHKDVDRVIMNHPSAADDYVGVASNALKPGGILHYYDFISEPEPDKKAHDKIMRLIKESHREIDEILKIRRVRDSAPYEYQMAVDVRLI
ncbi:MAG: class I SAM-dependent methyltransferase family protein [Candidatus Thorarchaeota archaeon]|nr:class I SAM-dependent methyltransferase family protein [Candidatus Thorarchaeota archaeon]